MKLAEFQKKFILAVYDNPKGTNYGYLSIGRKNGKTGLIAALVLAHIDGPAALLNSHIISGARSRDQAALVFRLASKMVKLNPTLTERIRITPSNKTLHGLAMGTEYKAISAEATTALGESPVLAILDEMGQVIGPQDAFVDAITTAQGAYDNPLLLAISTQAPNDGDLFSIWLDDAKKNEDPHTIAHVYAADKDAEVLDESAWQASNPALGQFRSYEDLKRQAEKASRMPSQENSFRNLILNQRVSTNSPFVSNSVWEENKGDPAPLTGQDVYGGLDLSSRTDLTALVLQFREDGKTHVHSYFWVPEDGLLDRAKRDRVPYDVWKRNGSLRTTPGKTVDYAYVVQDLGEILSECNSAKIGFDRWRMDFFKKDLERAGLELDLVPFGQGFKDMSPALDFLESELLDGSVRHGGNPVLRMCAYNAVVVKDTAGNRKLAKDKAIGRIDGMVALSMAMGVEGIYFEEEAEFSAMAAIG